MGEYKQEDKQREREKQAARRAGAWFGAPSQNPGIVTEPKADT